MQIEILGRFFIVLWLLALINEVVSINSMLYVGDECQGPKNLTGICTRILNCKFYIQSVDMKLKRMFLGNAYNFCRFDGTTQDDQVVCCPSRCKTACNSFKALIKPPVPPLFEDNIIFGEEADVAEFPHFAALKSNDDGKLTFTCGGVLVSDKFVLTAAHCAVETNNLTSVLLGKTSLVETSRDTFDAVDVKISKIILHPNYNVSQKYNDIALLELEHPVSFNFNVWPACLKDPHSETPTLEDFTITGFGYTNDRGDGGQKSDWMMKAKVHETPLDACQTIYDQRYPMKSGIRHMLAKNLIKYQVCARNENTSATTCQGDSGSGLMYKLDDQFYVYGITSFGPSCKSKIPSIYTRVSSYLKWIEDIVWPFQ